MIQELSFETCFRQAPEELFPFFAEAANLERLTPGHLRFRILTPPPLVMRPDLCIDYHLRLHGLPFRWRTRITRWEPPRLFQDVQERGPWALWEHTHEFSPLPGGGTLMVDHLRLVPPFGWLGRLLWPLLAREVAAIFAHREAVLRSLYGSGPLANR